ncbi:transcriptional regulator [Streptomyces antimycoticus]|uniref:Transcriptional regulator n=1 Tax=Streptomyces antimycoticus TaxID=68175 RepID=A0A499UQB4_9ACTN|nr:helix-turn-helix transcriptional regulator [Streptomyces antimycoticus]BBJ44295.1 transcriptional regulator [Streptomyces antimycoticus]
MGLRANSTQRQRRLGEELRKLREASGLSATEAGAHAGLGRAHMSHIETGRTAIPEEKLRALAAAYGCTSHPLVDGLCELSRATGRGWWSSYKVSHNARALDLAELEASAVAHRSFQWMYVPGLLQTADYMRCLFESGQPDSPKVIDAGVEFRQRRQHVLADGSQLFHAVIHEAALLMKFVPGDVMRRQIEHLVTMAELPHVCIQLLPFKSDVNSTTPGAPFSILDSRVPELSTVYVEHPVSSVFLGDHEHLTQYNSAFEHLSAVALPPMALQGERKCYTERDSLQLIQHLLYTL